jgi:GNAT superfamily N-acetyltransferase
MHAFARMAQLCGGAAVADHEVLLYRTTSTDPVVWNGALLTADPPEPAAVLARADDFFLRAGRGYGFWIVASRDARMASHLRETGFAQVADDPHMISSVSELPPLRDLGVRLVTVSTEADRRSFVECAGQSFHDLGVAPATWPSVYPSLESVRQDDVITVVATDSTRPVAAAMGYLDRSVCEIIHVGTVPAARGRGLGAAVTTFVVREAAERGATHAVLQSTEMGLAVYRSLGFREIDRYQLFLRRST